MRSPFILIAAAIFAFPGTTDAAIALTTTGVYDETGNANAVDATAPGSSSTLAAFKTSISTAYGNNTGGVITFDNITMPVNPDPFLQDPVLTVTYGASALRTLTITHDSTGGDFQFQRNDAVGTAISGNSYLRNSGPGGTPSQGNHNYIFSTSLSELGFTILSRNGARTVTATVTYDDGTTASLTDTMANGVTVDDTFFHFAAGSSAIKSLRLVASPNTDFFAIDDLAFIIPEPSTALLGLAGLTGLLLRRRRNV